jgi:hypothetical protein
MSTRKQRKRMALQIAEAEAREKEQKKPQKKKTTKKKKVDES